MVKQLRHAQLAFPWGLPRPAPLAVTVTVLGGATGRVDAAACSNRLKY